MSLNVAVQMDPIEKISIKGDSTFALMLEAQVRGHTLFYYQTKTLALAGGILSATGQDVRVKDEASNFYSLGEKQRVDLSDYDVVLMRQDPPFDMGYITATHMLDHIHPRTLVVNDPHAGSYPSQNAGGERPHRGAQRAGETFCFELQGIHAGHVDHPRRLRACGLSHGA